MNKHYFSSPEDYIKHVTGLVKQLDENYKGSNYTCVEQIEDLYGLKFGTEQQREDGEVDFNNVVIEFPELMPKHYPCVMVEMTDKGADRIGAYQIVLYEYVYLDDFGM